jgi:putative Mg2+ transporter-C (MgtC) family protein
MQIWLADSLFAGPGQATRQIIELLAAFGLTSLVGLERTIQGKSAGLRTQTIVGTSVALILLISKYGFGDVLKSGAVELDPSRIAAQIVSGIGFLGAGIIITRRGAVHGLTTAAAVRESAAIGMAAGAGLVGLAVVVVALHFISAFAYSPLERQLTGRVHGTVRLHITTAARVCCGSCCGFVGAGSGTSTNSIRRRSMSSAVVGVTITLSGAKIMDATDTLAGVVGVGAVLQAADEPE